MQFVDPGLKRQIFSWFSPRLGMEWPIVRYGDWGRALLIVPTAGGDFLEAERMFLIKAMEPFIFAGKLQVFCINSINPWAWMNDSVPVHESVRRQSLYSGYIEEEVVPHIRNCLQNPSARIGIGGASFGAFYAANAFFRRPDQFDTLLAMSGFYDLKNYLGGFHSDEAYFNNPSAFVANLNDGRQLELLRNSNINILAGRGSFERPEASERFSQLLASKGIPHNLDLWGHDVAHDWPWWRKMVDHYVGHRLGW